MNQGIIQEAGVVMTFLRSAVFLLILVLVVGCGEGGESGQTSAGNEPKWKMPESWERKEYTERAMKDVVKKHRGYGYTFAVAFSDDGKRLVMGGGRGIQILNGETMDVIHFVKGSDFERKQGKVWGISCVERADFIDDNTIVAGGDLGELLIIDMKEVKTEKKINIFCFEDGNKVAVKSMGDGKRVITSGEVVVKKGEEEGKIVRKWGDELLCQSVCIVNIESGKVEQEYINARLVGLSRKAGKFVITRAEKGKEGEKEKYFLEVYECEGLKRVASLPVEQHGTARGRFSEDGRWLFMEIGIESYEANLAENRYLMVLDMKDYRVITKFDPKMVNARFIGGPAGITNDGRYVLTVGDTAYVIDIEKMKIVKGWYLGVYDGVATPDGKKLLMWDHESGTAYLVDVSSAMKEEK